MRIARRGSGSSCFFFALVFAAECIVFLHSQFCCFSLQRVSGLGSQVVGFRLQFPIPWFYIHRSQVLVRGLKVKVLGSPKISSLDFVSSVSVLSVGA